MGAPARNKGPARSVVETLSALPTGAMLTGIVLVAFAVRVYLCFWSGLPVFSTDTYFYLEMADAILRGSPLSAFPNGYPLIVAAMKSLAGDRHLVAALLLLNVLMSTGTVLSAFFIARAVADERIAIVVAAVLALWPNQLNYTRQLLSEVPSGFFLSLGFALMLYAHALWAGIFWSSAALVRSTLLPVAPLESAYLFLRRRNADGFLVLIGFLLGIAAELLLVKLGIVQRASNFGLNLLIAVGSTGSDNVDFSASAFSDEQKAHALATYVWFAFEHPAEFLWQRASALWELWGPWPNVGDAAYPRSFAARVLIGLRFPMLLLAIGACWVRRSSVDIGLIAIPIVVVTATHVVFFSTPRFTFSIEPLVLTLAILGASDILRGGANRLYGRAGQDASGPSRPPHPSA